MADDNNSSEIQINVKGPNELKLQITISKDRSVLELKQAIAAQSDVEADRQRLIYSGRVLKDEDALSVYKIQTSHTIHMVKGASRSGASTQQPSQPQTFPSMQAGQNPHDPLTQLTGHQAYGLMAGLNPFAELGVNQNDPNMLNTLMNSPQFLQQMSSVMSNPAILDQIIASNPQLAAMGPQVREVFQSENFRQMMSNPESLRTMLQMASMFQGGAGGNPSFPAPGVPSTAALPSNTTPAATGQPSGQSTDAANLASLFGIPTGATEGGATPTFPPPNPALLQQILGQGFAPGAYSGGFGAPPADSRPPEERFQVQLQQLQDMGFINAAQNIRALLATGGNVHSAIEYILSGGGL